MGMMMAPDVTLSNPVPATVIVSYPGQSETVDVTLTNNTADSVTDISYCVVDPTFAQIDSVTLSGGTIRLATTAGPGGQTCFLISEADLQALQGRDSLGNESITVREHWTFTCQQEGNLERSVTYDCDDLMPCTSTALTNAVSVNPESPVLTVGITPDNATLTVCGNAQTYSATLENTGTEGTLTNLTGMLNLPEGLTLVGVASGTGGTVNTTATTNEIAISDLAAGETLTFSFDLEAGCNLMATSVTFDLAVTHDAVCVGGSTMSASAMITVHTEAPDVDIVSSSSSSENLAIGKQFSIDHTLQNTSMVPADTVYFCVSSNANAILDSVKVGSVMLAVDPDVGGACYLIEGGLLTGGDLNGAEQLTVTEYWRTTNCTDAADDLSRTATFGCAGTAACLDTDPPTVTDITFQTPANPYALTVTGATSVDACNDTITYEVTLENTAGDGIPLRDALINLDLEAGVTYFNVQATGDSVVQRVGEDILLGTLADGESTSFSVDVFYDCATAATTTLGLDVTYDNFCGGGTTTENETYGPITVNRAEPAITNQLPNSVRIINNKRDTVVTTVENIGTAAADTLLYCIKDNVNGTVESVSVAGVTLPIAGSAPTGYTCYIITEAAFQAALASDSLAAGASIMVSEHWYFQGVDCMEEAPNGERRVLFPCTASDQDCHDPLETDNTITSFFYPALAEPLPPTVSIEGPTSASVCGPDVSFTVTVSNENPGVNNYIITGLGAIGNLPEGMFFQ